MSACYVLLIWVSIAEALNEFLFFGGVGGARFALLECSALHCYNTYYVVHKWAGFQKLLFSRYWQMCKAKWNEYRFTAKRSSVFLLSLIHI